MLPWNVNVWLAFAGIMVTLVLQSTTLPVVARWLRVHPDDPTQDILAEAATEVAANYITDVAPADGTVIGIPVASLPIATFVQHKPGEGIDVEALNWIGRIDIIDAVTAVTATPITNQAMNVPISHTICIA